MVENRKIEGRVEPVSGKFKACSITDLKLDATLIDLTQMSAGTVDLAWVEIDSDDAICAESFQNYLGTLATAASQFQCYAALESTSSARKPRRFQPFLQ
jgi:hypothetical protein